MGLLDIAAKVLTTYQADTSQMKSELKGLQGAEKELAERELEHATARNEHADTWVEKLDKVGVGLEIVSHIVEKAFEALKKYGHTLDLEATAGSVSIDALAHAAGGLKTNLELLEHAAVFNKSAFALTQEQMNTVERAMWALEERGKSSTEVWDAVSTALTKGTTKALEGLVGPIDKSSGAFDLSGNVLESYGARAKAVDAVLKKLAQTTEEVKDGQYDEADAVQVTQVKISNAMEEMEKSIGKIVVAFEPLISVVARLTEKSAGLIAKLADGYSDIADLAGYVADNWYNDKTKSLSDNLLSDKARQDPRLAAVAKRHHVNLDPDTKIDAKGNRVIDNGDALDNWKASGGSEVDWVAHLIAQDSSKRDREAEQARIENRPERKYTDDLSLVERLKGLDPKDRNHDQAKEEVKAYLEQFLGAGPLNLEVEPELKARLAEANREREKMDHRMAEAVEEANRKAAANSARTAEELKAERKRLVNKEAKTSTDELVKKLQAEQDTRYEDERSERIFGPAADRQAKTKQEGAELAAGFAEFQPKLEKMWAAQAKHDKNQTFLEGIFGKHEEFDFYRKAFDGLSGAVTAGFGAWIDGSESAGQAIKKALAQTMKSEALNMAAQALKATATGLFYLAAGDPQAAGFFISAAEYAAAAIAFGVGAHELGGGGGGAGGGGGKSASAPAAPSVAAAPAGQTSSIIVIGDSFADDTPRMKQLRAERLVTLALGNKAIVYG